MNGSKPRVRTTVAFESNRPVPGLRSSAWPACISGGWRRSVVGISGDSLQRQSYL